MLNSCFHDSSCNSCSANCSLPAAKLTAIVIVVFSLLSNQNEWRAQQRIDKTNVGCLKLCTLTISAGCCCDFFFHSQTVLNSQSPMPRRRPVFECGCYASSSTTLSTDAGSVSYLPTDGVVSWTLLGGHGARPPEPVACNVLTLVDSVFANETPRAVFEAWHVA